ncbi:MAG: archease [Nitrososphaerales archaeon]|nr:archease [Nitrososphaerales archaeon]
MPLRFLPDVALADVAFEVTSPSLKGLFETCALGLTEVMVDPETVKGTMTRTMKLSSEDTDRLLYDFLTELIVIKDVDSLLFKAYSVTLGKDSRSLVCRMKGEAIDRKRQALRNDAKAVTMHLFGIRRSGKSWRATVVLDI